MRTNIATNLGGIGAGDPDAAPIDPWAPEEALRMRDDRRAPPAPPEPQPDGFQEECRLAVRQINDTIAQIASDIAGFGERLASLEAFVQQHRGQTAQLEANQPQIVQAFQTMDQRIRNHDQALVDLTKRFGANLRLAALDAAVKGKGPGERNEAVLKAAEAFIAFLDPPVPTEPEPDGDEPQAEPTVN